MCGRFGLSFDQDGIERRFGAQFAAEGFTPRYNAAPSQVLPVILNTDPKTIRYLTWGLKPQWARAMGKKDGIIHVRAETLRARPTFQRDVAERRCLVLADSFYAWKTRGRQKIPYRIMLKSGEPFAFAGIWEDNTDEHGQPVKAFAIITTGANALVGLVHHRMQVILRRETERQWLENHRPPEQLLKLLDAYPATLLQMYEVSPRVNRATEDFPDLIKPVG